MSTKLLLYRLVWKHTYSYLIHVLISCCLSSDLVDPTEILYLLRRKVSTNCFLQRFLSFLLFSSRLCLRVFLVCYDIHLFSFFYFIRISCYVPSNYVCWVVQVTLAYFSNWFSKIIVKQVNTCWQTRWDPPRLSLSTILLFCNICSCLLSFIEKNVLFMTTSVNFKVYVKYID